MDNTLRTEPSRNPDPVPDPNAPDAYADVLNAYIDAEPDRAVALQDVVEHVGIVLDENNDALPTPP